MMSHTPAVVSLADEKRARIEAETDNILDDTLLVLRQLAEVRRAARLPMRTRGVDLSAFVAVA